MALRCVDALINSTASGNDSERVAIHKFLRGQESEGRIDIAGHLFHDFLPLFLKIRKLAALTVSKAAKVECEDIVSGGAQHGSKLIVDLAIGIALVQEQNSRTCLTRRIERALQGKSIRSRKANFAFRSCRRFNRDDKNKEKYQGEPLHSPPPALRRIVRGDSTTIGPL